MGPIQFLQNKDSSQRECIAGFKHYINGSLLTYAVK